MNVKLKLLAGALLFGASVASVAPAGAVFAPATTIASEAGIRAETVHHRRWHRGGRGNHYGWKRGRGQHRGWYKRR